VPGWVIGLELVADGHNLVPRTVVDDLALRQLNGKSVGRQIGVWALEIAPTKEVSIRHFGCRSWKEEDFLMVLGCWVKNNL